MTNRYELEPLHRNTPDAELVEDLKRVATELGNISLTMVQYDERGRFSASTFQRRFGSWHRALEKAGLARVRNINTSEDRLFNNLASIWTRLGRQPRMTDLTSNTSAVSADTYKRRYGGWRNALGAFVRWANTGKAAVEESTVSANGSRVTLRRGPRDPSLRLRFLVMRRDNFKCRYCGRSPAKDPTAELNVDHIKSWSEGGSTVPDNLQTLCTKCNLGKSNLSAEGGGRPN